MQSATDDQDLYSARSKASKPFQKMIQVNKIFQPLLLHIHFKFQISVYELIWVSF